jgi:mono/diheme cytochrome c family protein
MFQFRCPRCQSTVLASGKVAGAKMPCPTCGQRLQVPGRHNQTVLAKIVPGLPDLLSSDPASTRQKLPVSKSPSQALRRFLGCGAIVAFLACIVVGALLLPGRKPSSVRPSYPSKSEEETVADTPSTPIESRLLPDPPTTPLSLDATTLAKKTREILKTHCYRCHGENGAVEGGFNYILDRDQLLARKKIVPGDAERSKLYRRLREGEMPPEGEQPRPSDDMVQIVRQWIDAGAPTEHPAAPQRTFVHDTDLVASMLADVLSLPTRERRFVRYFTLGHLYVGRHNLFSHPRGPGSTDNTFEPSGGEIIFNLPNGLQGYMLIDARGQRIDKGPTAIVSDPRRPDRAVENGLSCMACHTRGIVPKTDQIRKHVEKNPDAFSAEEIHLLKALFPPEERFRAAQEQDSERFRAAVVKTGRRAGATEPIVALTLQFESELDLKRTAAEVGCTPDEFRNQLQQSATLARSLGALKIPGGTLQRQVFTETFAEIVRQLGMRTPRRQME